MHFDASGGTDHIFVNGNLARVLLSTYRLQQKRTGHGNRDYLDQALGWCDTFCDLQQSIESSLRNPAGYWGAGYGGQQIVEPLCAEIVHMVVTYILVIQGQL